jgi:tripartite-type tricarboxylate transporter receptor subunit TctC
LFAQEDKSAITVLVGAASVFDATARIFADQLKDALQRPVVVVSKLGAGGRLAAAELKRAAPDGRTLMVGASSLFAIYPNVYSKLEYDPVADFTPVAGLTVFDLAVATSASSGVGSLQEFIANARKSGTGILYGAAPGNGSSSHFLGIAVGLAASVPATLVAYKEAAPAYGDLATGRLPLLITATGGLAPHHKAGKLKVLATSGDERSPLTPDVPTLKELGINVSITNSAGLFAPARTPRDIVTRLHQAIAPIYERPDLPQRLLAQGMVPRFTSPQGLAESLALDRRRYADLAKASGFVPEPN